MVVRITFTIEKIENLNSSEYTDIYHKSEAEVIQVDSGNPLVTLFYVQLARL